MILRTLYRFAWYLFGPVLHLGKWIGSAKSKKQIRGSFRALQEVQNGIPPKKEGQKRYWVHCASWGEFEMALPLVDRLQSTESIPSQWVFSFFSPSGYENAALPKNSYRVYLPFDHPIWVSRFQSALQPDLAIWVKYEFWLHHLSQLQLAGTPFWIWNASFRPNHFIFQSWAKPWLLAVSAAEKIAVQREDDRQWLLKYKLKAQVLGDARAFQTRKRLAQAQAPGELAEWIRLRPTFLLGSSWPEEEERLMEFWARHPELSQSWNWIIAPHNPSRPLPQEGRALDAYGPFGVKYSLANPRPDQNRLWLDGLGLLRSLYPLAQAAAVGGGFGRGLHNVYEALAAGCAVLCGPVTDKFPEAAAFEQDGFLKRELHWEPVLLEWLQNPQAIKDRGLAAAQAIQMQAERYQNALNDFLSQN